MCKSSSNLTITFPLLTDYHIGSYGSCPIALPLQSTSSSIDCAVVGPEGKSINTLVYRNSSLPFSLFHGAYRTLSDWSWRELWSRSTIAIPLLRRCSIPYLEASSIIQSTVIANQVRSQHSDYHESSWRIVIRWELVERAFRGTYPSIWSMWWWYRDPTRYCTFIKIYLFLFCFKVK